MSKTLDKLSKILNQAERAPEGSPEREVFMEKAMALSAAANIDLALARAHQAKKEKVEEPEERRYQVGIFRNAGGMNTPTNKNAHFVDLMIAICRANDLEVLISQSNVYVFAHGMPSDHEVADRLFAMLSVEMVQEADAGLKRGDNKEIQRVLITEKEEIPYHERAWGQWDYKRKRYYCEQGDEQEETIWSWAANREVKPHIPPAFQEVPLLDEHGEKQYEEKLVSRVDGRIWRSNFYQSFVNRIESRLREAKRQALKDAGIDLKDDSDSRTLALVDKQKVVRESFEENNRYVLATSRKSKGYMGAEVSSYSSGGQAAGRASADRARMGNERDID